MTYLFSAVTYASESSTNTHELVDDANQRTYLSSPGHKEDNIHHRASYMPQPIQRPLVLTPSNPVSL